MLIGTTKFNNITESDQATIEKARIEALNVIAGQRLDLPCVYQIPIKLSEPNEYFAKCCALIEHDPTGIYELHYYPNDVHHGMSWAWYNGEQFSEWYVNIASAIRDRFPNCQLAYPKLELGGCIGKLRRDSETFMHESRAAIDASDYVSIIVQWTDKGEDTHGVNIAQWYVSHVSHMLNVPLIVTFLNRNNNVPKYQKGVQYLDFYNRLREYDDVHFAFCHTLSSDKPEDSWLVWRSDKKESQIVDIIAGRQF